MASQDKGGLELAAVPGIFRTIDINWTERAASGYYIMINRDMEFTERELGQNENG